MPARLHFSNSLDALADRLIANLAAAGGDFFEPPAIAAAASAARDWLKIRLAEKLGIAANLEFPHLEALLWQRLAALDRHREAADRQPARLLDASAFQGLILAQLRRDPPAALRNYLDSGPEPEPYDAARRLCQLSGRLAALFREYEYSRVSEHGHAGLIESWSRGNACFEPYAARGRSRPDAGSRAELRELEAWQMEVYRSLFREDGLRDRWGKATGLYRYTLPQYAGMALQDPLLPEAGKAEARTWHLFGLSSISPFHRDLIRRLADGDALGSGAARFEIYALNPCAEYWEDALTPRESRARAAVPPWKRVAAEDPERARADAVADGDLREEDLSGDAEENTLLNRFGKPGRETVKLWNQVTDYDFYGSFREPRGDGVLATVQRALLRRSGRLPEELRRPQDASLRAASAPDRRAEIEAARADAAEQLLADPGLRPEDIALVAADLEAYLPAIEAVFGREETRPGFVPYCLPEAGMLRESALLRGFGALFELADGAFNRGAWMRFLENPAVQRRFRVEEARLPAIASFLERAGFQEGWDNDHMKIRGAAPGSLSTAAAAAERALLGLVLDPDDAGLEANGYHPAAGADAMLEREELARLLEWLETLRRDLAPLRSGEPRSFAEWSRLLRGLMEETLSAGSADALEARAEIDLRRFLADLELWGRWADDEPRDRVPHHVVFMLFQDHFADPRSARASFLQGGVRIGGLQALRGIPFRRVYVLGLNAGDFPSAREASPLDLRGYRRMPGETDPASRDLYALLEVVASAADGLTLSYVRRDARDNARQPSYAITGLAAYLENDVLDAPFETLELDAEGRHPNDRKGEDERKWGASPRPRLEDARVRAAAAGAWREASRRPTRWAAEPLAGSPATEWREIAEYLRNPAAHAAFRHFRLRPYGILDAEEEAGSALFLDGRESEAWVTYALREELLRPRNGGAEAARAWHLRAREGLAPPPPYSDLEGERLQAEIAEFLDRGTETLRAFLATSGLRFAGSLRIGEPGSQPLEAPIVSLPAFDAASLGFDRRIGGSFPLFFRPENAAGLEGGWALLLNKGLARETDAYLFHLCAIALAEEGSGPAFLIQRDRGALKIFRLPVLARAEAAEALRNLLQDFSGAPDFDALPLQTAEKILASRSETPGARFDAVRDWAETLEQREREEAEAGFLEPTPGMRALRALRAAIPEDAGEKIARRLLPFLRWKKSWETVDGDAAEETP